MSDESSSENMGSSLIQSYRRIVEKWPLTQPQTVLAFFIILGGGLYLYTGTWPPAYAVESGSMEPNIHAGDLLLVSPAGGVEGATTADSYDESVELYNIHTQEQSTVSSFGDNGSVIIFTQDENRIVHRAIAYTEHGENWVREYNLSTSQTQAQSCEAIEACPAPHDGYITQGDANPRVDQVRDDELGVIRPENVNAKAKTRIPIIGWFRVLIPL